MRNLRVIVSAYSTVSVGGMACKDIYEQQQQEDAATRSAKNHDILFREFHSTQGLPTPTPHGESTGKCIAPKGEDIFL